jgi:hypothetical protein
MCAVSNLPILLAWLFGPRLADLAWAVVFRNLAERGLCYA